MQRRYATLMLPTRGGDKKMANNKGIGAGGSSVLMVFVVLCLCIFGTLSLLSANADLVISNKTAAAAEGYYRADAEAERLLARIDACLFAARQETQEALLAGDFSQEALTRLSEQGQDYLRSLAKPLSAGDANGIYYHFAVYHLANVEGIMIIRGGENDFSPVIGFSREIGGERALSVRIGMNAYADAALKRYAVLTWNTVDDSPWEPDENSQIPVGER